MGLRGYRGLQELTRGDRGLLEVAGGYRRLQEVTGGYLCNRPHFLWVYRRDNPPGMLGKKYGSSTVIKSRLLSKVIISQS